MNSSGRLLIISRSLPFHLAGGMEHVAWDIARSAASGGCQVSVVTTRIPDRPARFTDSGVEVVAMQRARPGRYSSGFWQESRQWFREHASEYQAVLSVSAGGFGLLRERHRAPDVRFVLQAHGTSIGEIASKLRAPGLLRRLAAARNALWVGRDLLAYRKFDAIVAVGPRVEQQFRSPPISWFVSGDSVVGIDNGIDVSQFCPDPSVRTAIRTSFGWNDQDLVVGTACRLHPQKGVLQALRGFAAFAKSYPGTARYLVVGDGSDRLRLESEAKRLLPPNTCRFVGEVVRSDMPGLLNGMDVFLFTTFHMEVGLPLNVLEAQAVGLPLVVSDTLKTGPGMLSDAEGVNPGDPTSISGALAQTAETMRGNQQGARLSQLSNSRTLKVATSRYLEVLFNDGPR